MNIPTELFTAFNDVKYYDEPHKYYLDGEQLTSVTGLLGKYKDGFEEEKWAKIKGDEFGLSPLDMKKAWNFVKNKGTLKGSIVHDYLENKFLNKIFPYPYDTVIKTFGYDAIRPEYERSVQHADKFYDDSFGKLIPLKTELVLYDREHKMGGMIDMIFYNVKAKEIQIWDWKTNKDFEFSSNYRMKGVLQTLEKSDLEVYSLQLNAYKHMIQRNTSIKIGKCFLVWFSHRNPTYKVIECKDRMFYVNKMFEDHKFSLTA